MSDWDADIGEEAAKQAALSYLARVNPAWPRGLIQGVKREGPFYVVQLIPENRLGIFMFVSFKAYVNSTTGVVEKYV